MGQHGKHRPLVGLLFTLRRRVAIWATASALCIAGQTAAALDCRLALALAMDVSSSVDAEEDALQRRGIAAALIAPQVEAAFLAEPLPVALAIYEWSGRWNQTLILDWRLIRSRADLVAAAEVVARSQRSETKFPTALGYALGYGAGLLERAPECLFQTIDVSGDGLNNEGFGPRAAYREFPFDGVTVNALVVHPSDTDTADGVAAFFRDEVLRGPGAFLESAYGFGDFARAMRRKLEREVKPRPMGRADAPAPRRAPG